MLNNELTASGNKYIEVTAQTMRDNGQVATGETLQSLRLEITDRGYKVYVNRYAGVLQDGRRPGGMPPIEDIQRWIRAKGLNISPWAVAKKIQEQGTQLFRGEGSLQKPTNTFTAGVQPAVDLLRNQLIESITGQIRGAIREGFK